LVQVDDIDLVVPRRSGKSAALLDVHTGRIGHLEQHGQFPVGRVALGAGADHRGDHPTHPAGAVAAFLVNTPTVVATVDAALAAAIVVLHMQVAEASTAALVAGWVLAFTAVWGALLTLQRHTCIRDATIRPGSRPLQRHRKKVVARGWDLRTGPRRFPCCLPPSGYSQGCREAVAYERIDVRHVRWGQATCELDDRSELVKGGLAALAALEMLIDSSALLLVHVAVEVRGH
jgi:hypothetical protein